MQSSNLDIRWVRLEGGPFSMGSNDFYPEERPRHQRTVAPFEIAETPITNRQFSTFVHETGHVTIAELSLSETDYPTLSAEQRAAGSLVFTPTAGPVNLQDWRQWWRWQPGAYWQAPQGPGTNLKGLEDHPVVHVAYEDAVAFATWAGARLLTEPEHEFASQGATEGSSYPWGNERDPDGVIQANTWRGKFPYDNQGSLGWKGTSPVRTFPANNFGLFDCIGNVWEWTSTEYTADHRHIGADTTQETTAPCQCSPQNQRSRVEKPKVLKGGSHLCAPEYCHRYRPAARTSQTTDSSSSHIGFRIARDV